MAAKVDNLKISYDQDADVLYVSVGDARPAISEELDNGVVLRRDVDTDQIVGYTIVNFRRRLQEQQSPISLPIPCMHAAAV